MALPNPSLRFLPLATRLHSQRIPPRRLHSSTTRPSVAPRPSIDIKHIRLNPGLYETNCIDRKHIERAKHPWQILQLSNELRALELETLSRRQTQNDLRAQLNKIAALDGGQQIQSKVSRENTLEELRQLAETLGSADERQRTLKTQMADLAIGLPNLSSHYTPVGDEPLVLEYINEQAASSDSPGKPHAEIGVELGLIDFDGASGASGAGWYYLQGDGARLEHALVQYALEVAEKRGWTPVSPPSMVYEHIVRACGFDPRDQGKERQVYGIEVDEEADEGKPAKALAGTAEIAIAAKKANAVLDREQLPLKLVGSSRCFRREAGGRGKAGKGLYRVHEFTKVEMFAWTMPDVPVDDPGAARPRHTADDVFREMLSIQKEILGSLGLRCRVLEMPSGDMGASAARKQDIEAYFPSRRNRDDGWGEVTSASICTDFQTRRLNTRVRLEGQGNGKKLGFPFTVNGTAMAVPRVLAAIVENGWNEAERSVTIPEVLRPWMRGKSVIK